MLEGCRDLLPDKTIGFDPAEILLGGFMLKVGDDVGLFEGVTSRHCRGHYFFRSRGAAALKSARKILSFYFERMDVLSGLTPIDNRKALWFNRQLGFRKIDVVPTPLGDMQLSILTKEDYKE